MLRAWGAGKARPPPIPLRRDVGRWRERARLDLGLNVVQFGLDVGRKREVVQGVPGAAVRDVERQRAARERAVNHVLDRCVCGDVHLLEGARYDRRVRALLVGVDADAVDLGLARRLQHPEAAAAGDLEQDVRLRGDLTYGDAL